MLAAVPRGLEQDDTLNLAISFMFLAAEAIVHCSPRGRIAGTEAWTARFRRTNLMVLVAAVWVVHARIALVIGLR